MEEEEGRITLKEEGRSEPRKRGQGRCTQMKNGVVQLESTGINICGGGRAGFVYKQNTASVNGSEG